MVDLAEKTFYQGFDKSLDGNVIRVLPIPFSNPLLVLFKRHLLSFLNMSDLITGSMVFDGNIPHFLIALPLSAAFHPQIRWRLSQHDSPLHDVRPRLL